MRPATRRRETARDQHADKKQGQTIGVSSAEKGEKSVTVLGGKISRNIRPNRHESGVTQRKLSGVAVD